jgi:hypothetical protein|tara:strand:+ start:210 stop:398 length:189 start_codon:yes stop_codon:yes gene_type:complete
VAEEKKEKKLSSAHTTIGNKKTDEPIHDISEKDDEEWRKIVRDTIGEKRVQELEVLFGIRSE